MAGEIYIALESTSQDIKTAVEGVKTDVAGVKTDVGGVKTDVGGVKTETEGITLSNASIKAIVDEIQSRIGVTADTGGSASAGSIMSKLNAIIAATASGSGVIKHIQRGNYDNDTTPSITLAGFTNINKMVYIIHGTRASGSDDIPYNVSDVTLTINKLSMDKISGYGGAWRFAYQVIEFY